LVAIILPAALWFTRVLFALPAVAMQAGSGMVVLAVILPKLERAISCAAARRTTTACWYCVEKNS
jgi:hypothetical protein